MTFEEHLNKTKYEAGLSSDSTRGYVSYENFGWALEQLEKYRAELERVKYKLDHNETVRVQRLLDGVADG